MELKEITDKLQEKLGKEESAKISDDIANILVFDKANKELIAGKDEKIKKLENDKEVLITANGNLLLQVPQAKEENIQEGHEEQTKEPFDFRNVFDDKGKFKR